MESMLSRLPLLAGLLLLGSAMVMDPIGFVNKTRVVAAALVTFERRLFGIIWPEHPRTDPVAAGTLRGIRCAGLALCGLLLLAVWHG